MTKRIIFISIFYLFASNCFFSQQNILTINRKYYSLKDAQSVSSDSVFVLSIGNNDLTKFPIEILKFQNLRNLIIINYNIGEMYLDKSPLLTENEKEEAIQIFKTRGGDTRVDVEGLFPIYHKTTIKKIPKEIVELKKLESLYLDRHYFSRCKIRKLKKLLPKCNIERI